MSTVFIETDCTITAPDGTEYTASGAFVDDTNAVAYLGMDNIPEPVMMRSGTQYFRKGDIGTDWWSGTLTDWHGNKIGTYRPISTWWHGYCSRMYAITATINGRTYYGRTQGPGCYVNLRAHKHQ